MTDFPSIKTRQLNPAQRAAVRRAVAYFSRRYSANDKIPRRVRFELSDCGSFISLVVKVEEGTSTSILRILGGSWAHIFIRSRGGMTVKTCFHGCSSKNSYKTHVAKMLGARVA